MTNEIKANQDAIDEAILAVARSVGSGVGQPLKIQIEAPQLDQILTELRLIREKLTEIEMFGAGS